MHFTKSQIEEIARRLALITKRDSELPDAEIPLDESEKVPIIQYIPLVQDYENRLLSLADLRSLVLADVDQTAIACVLNVVCNTSGATVKIKGSTRTNYIGYYGEMVDVVITADGYDAWFGVVTLTQDHTVYVSLNKTGQGGGGPTSYYVRVINDQDADIMMNGSRVSPGEYRYFPEGSRVDIYVSKEGYTTEIRTIGSIDSNVDMPISLNPEHDVIIEPFLRFDNETLTIEKTGAPATVGVESNVVWVINEVESADEVEQETGTAPEAESDYVLNSYMIPLNEEIEG